MLSHAGSPSLFSAISCPTSTHCLAVGQGETKSPEGPITTAGLVAGITSGRPGYVSWVLGNGQVVEPDSDSLYGVGCTSASACMSAGKDAFIDGFVVPVNSDGAKKMLQTVDNDAMYGDSCFENDYCIATGAAYDQSGDQYGLAAGQKVSQTTKPAVWGGLGIGVLDGSACHSDNSKWCLAVGSDTNGDEGVVLPIYNGQSGNALMVPGATELSGIACEGSMYCVAVGQNSAGEGVLVGITAHNLGTTIPVPGTTNIVAVACASNLSCTAVGSDSGTAVVVKFSLPVS